MGFATERDFETVLSLQTTTRREKIIKRQLVTEGIGILTAARDEPQTVTIDDGPVNPENPEGTHSTHEISVTNPIWRQYGFSSMEGALAMLARFEAGVI
ncbi:hypothetical protein M0R72_11875 [Candidatus Pacearchaeota archaeon]|nr:hypothetical protein [Candidatus Pacearchaeota archaeon]